MRYSSVPAVVVLLVGAALYFVWDNWWVNWDGGFYLYLARSIEQGAGLTFPDRTTATFRGPGYPALFAVGWTVLEVSAKTAIWMSRAALLAGGALVAIVIRRVGGGFGDALIAGLAALIPALILESGGWYFVPDGLAAVLALLALATILTPVRVQGIAIGLVAGVVMGIAFLAKETAVFYVPIVVLVAWARAGPGAARTVGGYLVGFAGMAFGWVLWAEVVPSDQTFTTLPSAPLLVVLGVAILGGLWLMSASESRPARPSADMIWRRGLLAGASLLVGTWVTLWLLGEPTVMSVSAGTQRAGQELAFFFGWSWVPGLAVLVWAVVIGPRLGERLGGAWLAGLLMAAVGIAEALYAGTAALSMRNGVGGVLGLALLIGVVLGHSMERPSGRAKGVRVAALSVALGFLLLAGTVTARIDSLPRAEIGDWRNQAAEELRDWLDGAPFPSVATTPFFATYVWFLGGELPEPELIETHMAPAGVRSYERDDFCRVVWWAGDLDRCPGDGPLWVSDSSDRFVASIFAVPPDEIPPVVVVTGTETSGSPHNGAGLFYMIEEFDLGRILFASSEESLPHWAVAYEIDREAWASHQGPAVVQARLAGADALAEEVIVFDAVRYRELLGEVLP